MKKLLISILLGLVIFSLSSCSQDLPKSATSSSSVTTETTSGDQPVSKPDTDLIQLTIAGNELEKYTLIYAKSLYSSPQIKSFSTEHDFFKLIANDIAAKIYEDTGIKLSVKQDTKTDKSEFEILVGPTNREESQELKNLDVYSCLAKVAGTKLVIGGGYDSSSYTGNLKTSYCYASSYHAYDPIDKLIDSSIKQGSTKLDISANSDHSAKIDLVTVACIGDSITEGNQSSDWNYHSYPAVLQRILWQDHLVVNLGNSGRTMRDDLERRYSGTPQHTAMNNIASKIDYALVMLGTNDTHWDSKPWTSEDDERFLSSADRLVYELTSANDGVKVVIMNCPANYNGEDHAQPIIRYLQNKLPERFSKQGVDVTFFDMHKFTSENLKLNGYAADKLHPNDTGYVKIAEELSKVLADIQDGTYKYTLPKVDIDVSAQPPKRSEVPATSSNIIGTDLAEHYQDMNGNTYKTWKLSGTPYVFTNINLFSGKTITNIELPITSAKKGDVLTVSVVKYSHPNITETLSSHKLTVGYDCTKGWLGFDNLIIVVPEGYTLAFGTPSDTLVPLYITKATDGAYGFYGSVDGTTNNHITLAFNIYGKKQ